jgi:short-subunit dehydrogenase
VADVVVVTGASAGVGRAIARRFAEERAHIGLLARGSEGLDAAVEDVERAGGRAIAVAADVAEHTEVEAAAQMVEETFGPIDVWVNNAMTSVFAPFTEIAPEEFERVTAVTYFGFVNGTRAALARMEPRGRGVVVQVGSALAYRGIPLQSAYCGAKHAIQGFTDSIRAELLHRGSGVRLALVQLPALNTPQFDWGLSRLSRRPQPVPPIYDPDVAACAVVRIARHPRREVWVGASTAATVIANAVAPGLVDRYLGHFGVDAQQTAEAAAINRPHNLWQPVAADHGVHGAFGSRAHDRAIAVPAVWIRAATVAGLMGFGALIRHAVCRR